MALAAIWSSIRLPNLPGNPSTSQNNYIYSANSTTNGDKYDLRTDANFTEDTRMFVRVSRQQDMRVRSRQHACFPSAAAAIPPTIYTQAVTGPYARLLAHHRCRLSTSRSRGACRTISALRKASIWRAQSAGVFM